VVGVQATAPTSTTTKQRGSSNTSLTTASRSFTPSNSNPNIVLAKATLKHLASINTITSTLSILGSSEEAKLTTEEARADNQICTSTGSNSTPKTLASTTKQQAVKTTMKSTTTTIVTISGEGTSGNHRSLGAAVRVFIMPTQLESITTPSSNIHNHNFSLNNRNNKLFTLSTQHS